MSEWSNVSLSKSDKVKAFGGSNPPLCATKLKFYLGFEPKGSTPVGRTARHQGSQISFALQTFWDKGNTKHQNDTFEIYFKLSSSAGVDALPSLR